MNTQAEELVLEAYTLITAVNDKYSLLDGLNFDKTALIEESKVRIATIVAQLNTIYNSPNIEMKSVVELAEERHRMTQDEFDTLQIGNDVEYDGHKETVIDIKGNHGWVKLSISGWQNFDSCKLIKEY